MGSKRLELQIQGSTNFTFDVEGAWFPSWQPVYKEAANPPEIVEMRQVWEFRDCKIRGETTEALWDSLLAFIARLETRASHPTYVRLVRDPSSANVTELTLGSGGGHEKLGFEVVDGGLDNLVPDASYNTTATFTLRVSATKKFADATTGIVGWEQEVETRYENGLRVLEWRTTITTAEGTSAVTKAQTYAAIPTSALGGNHLYETGNDSSASGIDVVYTDADEQNSRTPTVCVAVSRIREVGIGVTNNGPGDAPDSVSKVVTVRTTSDEITTTTIASASGGGDSVAYNWVVGQAPSTWAEKEITKDDALHTAVGTWVQRKAKDSSSSASVAGPTKSTIEVEITGGAPAEQWIPRPNGLPPYRAANGAFQPWTATVTLTVERLGGNGSRDELAFPGEVSVSDGWFLDRNSSSETEPVIAERGADSDQHKWLRKARLVYRRGSEPPVTVLDLLNRSQSQVKSYLYPAGV